MSVYLLVEFLRFGFPSSIALQSSPAPTAQAAVRSDPIAMLSNVPEQHIGKDVDDNVSADTPRS